MKTMLLVCAVLSLSALSARGAPPVVHVSDGWLGLLGATPVWDEDFAAFDAATYFIQICGCEPGEAAYWDSENGYFVLTRPVVGDAGRIFLASEQVMDNWDAEFDYYMGGGLHDADGFTFAFCRSYDYPCHGGGAMDFWEADGFAVEFDS